ncbi:cytidylyltransferase domain-containing protein [uncultured Helicobacter sp.]|uniref:acylneuraminate cytidylyltransferase family protein n=1 Tax=uncultured Helicobacter sp. TaxID=175537 RepID=UPI00375374C1
MGIGISAIIPVREGSTRLKHKNILPFGECNLLIHKIRQLKKVAGIDEIIVSSDSELMLEMARSEGVATHRRAREFADERTKSFSELIEHLASEVGSGEHILYAPCVCPLCDEKDLANAIEVYQERVLGSKPACDITESRESKPMDWGSVCSPRFNNGGASGDPLSTSDSNLPQNLAYRKDVCLERLDDALTPNDTLDSKKSFVCSRSGASGDPLFTSGSNLPQANCNKMTGSREFDSVISVRSFKEYLWDSFKPINYRTGVHHTPSQNLPEYFVVVNGFYLAARENMRKWRYFFGARPYLVCLPQAHAIDIDTEFDYICAKAGYAYLREQNHFQNRSRGGGNLESSFTDSQSTSDSKFALANLHKMISPSSVYRESASPSGVPDALTLRILESRTRLRVCSRSGGNGGLAHIADTQVLCSKTCVNRMEWVA